MYNIYVYVVCILLYPLQMITNSLLIAIERWINQLNIINVHQCDVDLCSSCRHTGYLFITPYLWVHSHSLYIQMMCIKLYGTVCTFI